MFAKIFLSIVFMASSWGAMAQEDTAPWQAVVTDQIDALKDGSVRAALDLAGAGFRSSYDDPNKFLSDILRSGYGPIVESRSFDFGRFEKTEGGLVLQVVNLVGQDQSLYEAVYQMVDEPNVGWRVQGVVLRKVPGLGV
ncbi:hypothetical protein VW35_06635 [Devosia soli]|uniref:DUF4864 domain-containing protein n=1 Tax=Devosia soli TaxID=361041 RepID=A0A0F5LCX9_9HYPH|nr:DUF4864 domain-containing protein [Devosia soli]KKB80110.1 hypothetical protein VW35_06635 [Devosia soli]